MDSVCENKQGCQPPGDLGMELLTPTVFLDQRYGAASFRTQRSRPMAASPQVGIMMEQSATSAGETGMDLNGYKRRGVPSLENGFAASRKADKRYPPIALFP